MAGFLRARVNGEIYLLDEALKLSLDKQKKHNIEIVVDRFTLSKEIERSRIRDSVETALKVGKGLLLVQTKETNEETKDLSPHQFTDGKGTPIREQTQTNEQNRVKNK